ncbi:hypothetical protein MRX96_025335 [Rhipicephalus microplus]
MMAYPGTQADWYYDGAVRPRRGIHDVWASQSQVQAAALERRRRLLLRFRLAARLCRLKAQEKKPLEKLKELFAESTTGIDRLGGHREPMSLLDILHRVHRLLRRHRHQHRMQQACSAANSTEAQAGNLLYARPNTLDVINGTIRNILCDQTDPMDINMVHNFTTEELYPFLNVARKYNNSQTLLALGHTKQRMVLNCTVKGESCLDDSMYETSTNPTFGLCYCIFCSNFNASKISYQASNLPVDGLTLVLDIEREEYLRSSNGMYLSPLMTTYIGIEMRMMERLPAPYKDRCVTMWPPIWQKYVAPDQTYFQQMCFSVCSQVLILKKCQCMSEELPQVRNVTGAANIMCRKRRSPVCSEEILADTSYRSLKKCDCPLKCSQEIYKTSISRTGWAQSLRAKSSLQNRALVKAVIYFESIIVEKITQVPELSDATTLSNVGGFMGMYLGLSFLGHLRDFGDIRALAHLPVPKAARGGRTAANSAHGELRGVAEACKQGHSGHPKTTRDWSKQRTIWDILKDPGVNTGGLVALRRPSGAPQYGYFDSSDWKSAADEVFGPFNPLFLHRSFRPRAFY